MNNQVKNDIQLTKNVMLVIGVVLALPNDFSMRQNTYPLLQIMCSFDMIKNVIYTIQDVCVKWLIEMIRGKSIKQ